MNNTQSEAGKGDKQRPTDNAKYASQYEVIFGKKNSQMQNLSSAKDAVKISTKSIEKR